MAVGFITAPESWCSPISAAFSITSIAGGSTPRSRQRSTSRIAADSVAGPAPTNRTPVSSRSRSTAAISTRRFDAQEGRRNRGGAGARVLVVEEPLELRLQLRCSAAPLGGLEGIHRGPIVLPELVEELRRGSGEAE